MTRPIRTVRCTVCQLKQPDVLRCEKTHPRTWRQLVANACKRCRDRDGWMPVDWSRGYEPSAVRSGIRSDT